MSNDVRRPKQYEEMLYALCQTDKKIFLSYKDALVFAACLGFMKKEKVSFDKTSETIGMHIFKGEYDISVIQCIALCETKDPLMMSDENFENRIKLFEEYAAGGLGIIKTRVFDGPEEWSNAITSLVLESQSDESNILSDITGMAR